MYPGLVFSHYNQGDRYRQAGLQDCTKYEAAQRATQAAREVFQQNSAHLNGGGHRLRDRLLSVVSCFSKDDYAHLSSTASASGQYDEDLPDLRLDDDEGYQDPEYKHLLKPTGTGLSDSPSYEI